MTPREIDQQRNDYVNRKEIILAAKIKTLQRETFEMVEKEILDLLDIDGDALKPTATNFRKMSAFKKIERELRNGSRKELIQWLLNTLERQYGYARDYFRNLVGGHGKDKLVKARFKARLGVNKDGFVSRGVLYDIWNDGSDIKEIQKAVVKGISGGQKVSTFKKMIRGAVLGDNIRQGIIQKNWRVATQDIIAQNDRQLDKEYAQEIGMQFYQYSGGLMNTTRPFCEERNRKVFHESEILGWTNMDWKGKSSPYDPFVDVGGYNCRHVLRPISIERARQLGKNVDAFI